MRQEEELRFLILGAQREGSRALTAALVPTGLTPAQAEVVRCLADVGPVSLKALGEMLVCEAGSPSRLVDTLVTRGIVERREDPADRRQIILMLTTRGARLDAAVREVEDALYARLRAQLGRAGVSAALKLLRPMLEGTLPGRAIARRKAMPGKT